MTAGRPPVAVRLSTALALVHAVLVGGGAALVFLFTLAFYSQDNPPDGKTVADNAVLLAVEAVVVALAVVLGLAAPRLRRGSEPARRTVVGLEVLVGVGGLALGIEALGFGLVPGIVVWLVVLVPAVGSVVALTGADSRGWCR